MKIVQITDLHYSLPEEDTFGTDINGNLEKVLTALEGEEFDALAITGDLCYRDGSIQAYEDIKKLLSRFDVPLYIVPGNHDDAHMIGGVFGCKELVKNGKIFFSVDFEGGVAVFLDTANGNLDDEQLAYFREVGERNPDKKILLFLHHPPTIAGVNYMDRKYPLENADSVTQKLHEMPFRFFAFCGHYHVEKTVLSNNMSLFITPSMFYQMRQDTHDFAIADYRVGWRVIEPTEFGVNTYVRYV